MRLNPFSKKPKKQVDVAKKIEETELSDVSIPKSTSPIAGVGAYGGRSVLRGMYVSEKSSYLTSINQYVFKVDLHANKSEIKKEVSVRYNVRVRSVRILNMPEKRRDFGRHPGTRSPFRKAIVALKEGYSIERAGA